MFMLMLGVLGGIAVVFTRSQEPTGRGPLL